MFSFNSHDIVNKKTKFHSRKKKLTEDYIKANVTVEIISPCFLARSEFLLENA
jgi:hypothetical protein